ncbi:MAG: hypothetical protein ACR2QI_10685 [Woeseiaceae bacterium]
MSRLRYIAILLFAVVSVSVADVHAASHVQSDLGECELCATYGDPSDAVPVNGILLPPIATYLVVSEFSQLADTTSAIYSVHQRGPPLAI